MSERLSRMPIGAQAAQLQQTENVSEAPMDKYIQNQPQLRDPEKSNSITGGAYDPVLITEACSLPSRGLLYGGELGETLTLRSMTTVEERMRLSGTNFWRTMAAILNRCKVGTDFNMESLVDFDFFAALVRLRIVSYGNNYKIPAECPICKKEQTLDIPLDKVAVDFLPEDFKEPFEIGPLPRSKDVLKVRFLRVYDHIAILDKLTEWHRKHKDDTIDDPEYTLIMEHMIVAVNGVELNDIQKRRYVETLNAMDSSYYHDKVNELTFGVNRFGISECKENDCNSPILYQIAPTDSFFRATPLDDKWD